MAAAISLWGGAAVTALDWSVYDRWLRGRAVLPDTPALVVVVRDPASEARFGAGAWDRAVIARVEAAIEFVEAAPGMSVVGIYWIDDAARQREPLFFHARDEAAVAEQRCR